MTVKELIEKYPDYFELAAGAGGINREIKNAYVGDLLSWVMGRAPEAAAWITIQGHVNIVAVAELVEASVIIVAESAEIFDESKQKADEENIPIISTKLTHFETARVLINEGL